jgi:hypothetical protein
MLSILYKGKTITLLPLTVVGIPIINFDYPTWVGVLISFGTGVFIGILAPVIVRPIVSHWLYRDNDTFARYSPVQFVVISD